MGKNKLGECVNPSQLACPTTLIPPQTPSILVLAFHQVVVSSLGA